MRFVVENVKLFYELDEDGVFDIGILGDGIWRRKGYLFIFGIVIVMSTVIGKVIDIEFMFKECRECIVWRNKEGI